MRSTNPHQQITKIE